MNADTPSLVAATRHSGPRLIRNRPLRAGGWIFLALLTLVPLYAAGSASAGLSREDGVSLYRSVQEVVDTPEGWTGSTRSCRVGTESERSLDATLLTINALREFAGVGRVSLDADKNRRALTAALMMAAEGRLSHHPKESWACYSDEGYRGASSSNLYLGMSGPGAMIGYADDGGVASLGHRRWLLDPAAEEFGTGSTGRSNALLVFGSNREGDGSDPQLDRSVAWPPEGAFPWSWIPATWSFALPDGESLLSDRPPEVRVSSGGERLRVTKVRELEGNYGTGDTYSWRVEIPDSLKGRDIGIDVEVSDPANRDDPILASYTVRPFDIEKRKHDVRRFDSRIRLSRAGQSNRRKTFAVHYNKRIRGKRATVTIRKKKVSCDALGSCSGVGSRIVSKYRIRLTGRPRIRVAKPRDGYGITVLNVSFARQKTKAGVIRGASATREILGSSLRR